ncbi:response regulator [Terrimonas ferruginea]|uniref:response regulator n=1 Tax=Terrimonas ferruginea TaxID=249 RepID=UPI00048D75FA|nr:response regulator transcription factor [Terrimonas ferruginea]
MNPKILIADDHVVVRLGLEMLIRNNSQLSIQIEHATSGDIAFSFLKQQEFDMLIMDMNMPGLNGLALLEKAIKLQPLLKILVLSVNPQEYFAPKCHQLGAYGFISKNSGDEELKKAILSIMNGHPYFPGYIRQTDGNNTPAGNDMLKQLSTRELDVTMLLLQGKGTLEIAAALTISPSTASTFKGRIFKKLRITSLLELDGLARRHGLVAHSA